MYCFNCYCVGSFYWLPLLVFSYIPEPCSFLTKAVLELYNPFDGSENCKIHFFWVYLDIALLRYSWSHNLVELWWSQSINGDRKITFRLNPFLNSDLTYWVKSQFTNYQLACWHTCLHHHFRNLFSVSLYFLTDFVIVKHIYYWICFNNTIWISLMKFGGIQ